MLANGTVTGFAGTVGESLSDVVNLGGEAKAAWAFPQTSFQGTALAKGGIWLLLTGDLMVVAGGHLVHAKGTIKKGGVASGASTSPLTSEYNCVLAHST